MSLTSVSEALNDLLRDITIRVKDTKTLVRGRYVTTESAPEVKRAVLLPATNDDLDNFPEGTFTLQDMTLHSKEDLGLKQNDIIEADGKEFLVIGIEDRDIYGGFFVYFLKKNPRVPAEVL